MMPFSSHVFSLALISSILVAIANANIFGLDLNGNNPNTTVFDCLKNEQNMDLVVTGVKGYVTGGVGPDTCSILQNAKSSGFSSRDILFYSFPGGQTDGSESIKYTVDYINTNCKDAFNGIIWIDVYITQDWPTPWGKVGYNDNKNWLTGTVNYCVSSKTNCGIRATASSYKALFDDTNFNVAGKAGLPLWSVGSSSNFGGWTKPPSQMIGDAVSPGTYASCHMEFLFYTATKVA